MSLRIAVTVGDPRGIGPEVVARALEDLPARAQYVVLGPRALIAEMPADERVAVDEGEDGAEAEHDAGRATTRSVSPLTLSVSPERAGLLTARAVERAVALARAGDVDAVVTAPAAKRALHAAGYEVPGHTEWLGQLAGGADVAMLLQAGALRVVMLTTHIPLRAVPETVTAERVRTVAGIARRALERWWGIAEPRLALCALNPHAGEGGLFGDEDDRVLSPVARDLQLVGPLPADTVFVRALEGEFDAVLTPAHDVGMTAVKVAGFGTGVNVTLGLPFVRTAPDHGTAFDIAGRGIADAGSMREAVKLAVELVGRRDTGNEQRETSDEQRATSNEKREP